MSFIVNLNVYVKFICVIIARLKVRIYFIFLTEQQYFDIAVLT